MRLKSKVMTGKITLMLEVVINKLLKNIFFHHQISL